MIEIYKNIYVGDEQDYYSINDKKIGQYFIVVNILSIAIL